MNEMTNTDFICFMHEAAHPHDNPSSEHAEIMDEAARRIRNLEAELQAWKAAADGGAGCDTPEGLANFIYNWGDYC